MAAIKSVHFSPILEQATDDISTASSDVGLFPNGRKFEDAYIASLSRSAKKYHLPTADEQRLSQRRKRTLLALGFILLLGITGIVIYLVTRELSNMERYSYSKASGEREPTFASRNTSLHYSSITMGSLGTKKASLEYSKTPASVSSVKVANNLATEKRHPDSRIFTPSTIMDSSSLEKSSETKETTSSFSTPSLAALRKTSSCSVVTQNSNRFRSDMKTVISYFATLGSYWEDGHPSKSITFTKSNLKAIISTSTVSSADLTRSNFLDTRGNVSFAQKASPVTSSSQSTPPQSNGTLVKESPRSSYAKYTYSSEIRESSGIAHAKPYSYSKSEYSDFEPATKIGEYSRSVHASFTYFPPSSPSKSKNSVEAVTGGTNMETTRGLPTTKSSAFSYLTSTRIMNPSTRDLLVSILSQVPASSQSTSLQPTSPVAMTKNTQEMFTSKNVSSSLVHKMHSYHYQSLGLIQSSLTSKESHPSDAPLSHLSKDQSATSTSMHHFVIGSLIQEQSSKPSFKASVRKTPFPYSSLIHKGSTALPEIRKTTKTSSPIPFPMYTSHDSEISTVVKVTSLKIAESLPKDLRTSPSGTSTASFGIALSLMTKSSSTESAASRSLPGDILSPPVTIANSVSSWDLSQNYSKSYSSPSTPGHISASTEVSSKQTGNIGFPTISSSSENLTSEVSTTESASTPTLFNSKFLSTSKQTSHKVTSDRLHKSTVTGFSFTPVLPSKPATVLSQNLPHFSRSSSFDELATRWTSSKAGDGKPVPATIISSDRHLTINKSHETSQHVTLNQPTSDFPKTKTLAASRFPITTALSPEKSMSSVVGPGRASRTASVQLTNAWYLSVATSSFELWNWKSSTDSLRTRGQSVSTIQLQKPFESNAYKYPRNTATNLTVTEITINTGQPSEQSMALSINLSFTSPIVFASISSSKIPWNVSIMIHSLNATADANLKLSPTPNYTSTSQVRPLQTTDYYPLSSAIPTFMPTLNSSSQFQIMDGSLVIRNKHFHTNLSNPNSTMFKALADEVEEIIEEILSVDAEVTSFREGSVIALFYLRVAHDSLYNDSDYAKILREANETLWHGYDVTNITVTLRVYTERPPPQYAAIQDYGGLSKAAVVAIFTVLSVLLIAVGGFGVYVCIKKGYCERSRVKPADSPIPPSELEKIQPVRRGTWVMNDEPFLKVDVPKDPNHRSASFYETLSMRVLERNDTEQEGSQCDPDLLRKSTRSPFEPDRSSSEAGNSAIGNAFPSTSRSMSSSMMNDKLDGTDRPFSGSSRSTYLNIAADSSHSENDC